MSRDTRERIEIAKRRIREMPIDEKKSTKRAKYRRGVKEYLSSFDIGEQREFEGDLRWDSLRAVACKLKTDYGCQFRFKCQGGKRFITRVK